MANITNFSTGACFPSMEPLLRPNDYFSLSNYHPLLANPFLMTLNSSTIQEDISSHEESKIENVHVSKKRKIVAVDLTKSSSDNAKKIPVIDISNSDELLNSADDLLDSSDDLLDSADELLEVPFYEMQPTMSKLYRKRYHLMNWIYCKSQPIPYTRGYSEGLYTPPTHYKGDIYNPDKLKPGVVIYENKETLFDQNKEVLENCFILKKAAFFQQGTCRGPGIIECQSLRGTYTIDVCFETINIHLPNVEEIFRGNLVKKKKYKRLNPHYFLKV